MERTLLLIKPNPNPVGRTGAILSMAEEAGFRIIGLRLLHLSVAEAEAFYAVHRERPFFRRLIEHMTSGPIAAVALEKDNAVQDLRALMGPTDPAEAPPGTIRQRFGTSITANSVHGSDSPKNAAVELAFFFSGRELL
jgi:nucleoside-diphosphate kinase